jgi:hypothetical protein
MRDSRSYDVGQFNTFEGDDVILASPPGLYKHRKLLNET